MQRTAASRNCIAGDGEGGGLMATLMGPPVLTLVMLLNLTLAVVMLKQRRYGWALAHTIVGGSVLVLTLIWLFGV